MEKSMKMRHSHNRILFTCNLNQYLKKRLQRASVLKVNKMVIGHKIYICLQSVTILQLYYFPWSGHPINILYRISYKHDVEQWCDKGTAEYKWPVYVEGRKVVNGTKKCRSRQRWLNNPGKHTVHNTIFFWKTKHCISTPKGSFYELW